MSVRFEDLKVGDEVKASPEDILGIYTIACLSDEDDESVLIQVPKSYFFGWPGYKHAERYKAKGVVLNVEQWNHWWIQTDTIHQHFPKKAPIQAVLACIHCYESNPWAEPNLTENRFLCYGCRSTPTTLMRYEQLLLKV